MRLELADMLEGHSLVDTPVDVIFSGFALHHLAVEDKARFFALTRNALKPGGALLLTDVMREPGQSCEDYLNAFLDYAGQHWQSVVPAEFTLCASMWEISIIRKPQRPMSAWPGNPVLRRPGS